MTFFYYQQVSDEALEGFSKTLSAELTYETQNDEGL